MFVVHKHQVFDIGDSSLDGLRLVTKDNEFHLLCPLSFCLLLTLMRLDAMLELPCGEAQLAKDLREASTPQLRRN